MWEYQGIFCEIPSMPQNNVMDLNNVINRKIHPTL